MAANDPKRTVVSEVIFVGAGLPANTGEARAILRFACFAGKPAPTGLRRPRKMSNSSTCAMAGMGRKQPFANDRYRQTSPVTVLRKCPSRTYWEIASRRGVQALGVGYNGRDQNDRELRLDSINAI